MPTEDPPPRPSFLLLALASLLGRLPTKKDFDNASCSRIKAYLGPWPRALEAAGLKPPRNTEDSEKTK